MRFSREIATPVLCRELLPLLRKHWEEISYYKDIALKPDFGQYLRMEELGGLRVFTARNDKGEITGYAIFFVQPHPQFQDSLQALQDSLFVAPAHRGMGGLLIRYADRELQREGVQVVYHHTPVQKPFGKLLERLGYELVDQVYARRLN